MGWNLAIADLSRDPHLPNDVMGNLPHLRSLKALASLTAAPGHTASHYSIALTGVEGLRPAFTCASDAASVCSSSASLVNISSDKGGHPKVGYCARHFSQVRHACQVMCIPLPGFPS